MEKKSSAAPEIGDIGGLDIPEIDLDLFDITDEEDGIETRYTKPRLQRRHADFVRYDNAVKLARALRLDKGERADAIVSGNFIFGDFIEAYLVEHRAHCPRMTIATLSLNQNNVDSLHNLLQAGYIDDLTLIVSVYFWAYERKALIPYIYERLDRQAPGARFQLAIADIHTKTVHFETDGGRKIVIHGSANLRSSGNIEQITIEENPDLYDFYQDTYAKVVERYATIRQPVRAVALWEEISKHKFND